MNAAIYSWAGDHFCSGCLIYAMTPHHPWNQWATEREVSDFSTAEALADMARYFNVHGKHNQEDMGFPVRVWPGNDSTIFCAVCLTLLQQVP